MPQNVFTVVLTDGQEKGSALLREAYPKAYEPEDNIFLVADDVLSSKIAKAVGLTKEDEDRGIRGAVFKLNGSYAGYTRQSLWEWLEDAENV